VKKISSYLLIAIGALIIILGLTGNVRGIVDSLLQRLGLVNDLGDISMGFSPLDVPVSAIRGQQAAPAINATLPPLVKTRLFIPTPTRRSLAPFTTPLPFTTDVPSPTPTEILPTPTTIPNIPTRLEIPSIGLDAPIIPAKPAEVNVGGSIFEQYKAPDEFAVGWHSTSAWLGSIGNTVLNGHHNINGKVFENLHNVVPGDEIIVSGGDLNYTYIVVNVMILPERNVDLSVRLENARWILPSTDERLTLITCWPATSNTHRLIVVAQPLGTPQNISDPTPQTVETINPGQ